MHWTEQSGRMIFRRPQMMGKARGEEEDSVYTSTTVSVNGENMSHSRETSTDYESITASALSISSRPTVDEQS